MRIFEISLLSWILSIASLAMDTDNMTARYAVYTFTVLWIIFADVIEVMLEYGAVNAYNLDGGSSTVLYYNGEYVNSASPLTGSRLIPTAFIVK
jgi:hypothetical protein